MKEITEIEIQKKNKKRVSIYLNDRYGFGLDILTASSLSRGEVLTDQKIMELKMKDAYSRALNNAVGYLGSRARSLKEVRQYLKAKDYEDETIESVVAKLLEQDYLNDKEFALLWVDSRKRFNPKGVWILRQELMQKGVSDNDIEYALKDFNENSAALSAVEKKIDRWRTLEPDKIKKKIYTYLSSRGFSYETTDEISKRVLAEIENRGSQI